jgi:predicted Zn-dependent protease
MKNYIKILVTLIITLVMCEVLFSPNQKNTILPIGAKDVHGNCCYSKSTCVSNQKINFPKYTITIKPLGDVDYSILIEATNIIRNFYGWDVRIGGQVELTNDLYISGSNIVNADVCLRKFFSQERVVYIVNKRLWCTGNYIKGYASLNGGTVIAMADKSYLKETLLHEIAHTLGLVHCSDLRCIMAINNDQYETGTFCNNCKRKLGIYE